MKHALLTGISTAILLLAGNAIAAPSCARNEEFKALTARVLQSDLMVAALSCNQKKEYNAFVKRFKTQLIDRGEMVRGYFARVNGAGHTAALNRFITQIANDSSQRSLDTDEHSYCAATQELFKKALALPAAKFSTLLLNTEYSSRHGIKPCNAQWAKAE